MFRSYKKALVVGFCIILIGILSWVAYYSLPKSETNQSPDTKITDGKLAPRSNTVDITSDDKEKIEVVGDGDVNNEAAVVLAAGCKLVVTVVPVVKIGSVQYAITLKNRGNEDCQNVSYSVYYPEHEHYVRANPKPTASDYYWVVGTIKSATAKRFQLTTVFTDTFGGIDMCATASNLSSDACYSAVTSGQVTLPPVLSELPMATSTPNALPIPPPANAFLVPNGKEYGVWIWNSPITMSSQKMDEVLLSAKSHGFNTLYVTIDDVSNYNEATYSKSVALFISKATASGLAVDAVAGASDWAKPGVRTKGFEKIDFVKRYNASNPKFRGFQYDVEPYLLPEYEGNKETVLTDFVAFIDESAKRLEDSGISFGVVIPHFYDSTQAWTPKVTYNDVSTYTFDHIRAILDRNAGNTIIVMAYRNYFSGKNGTAELVTPEIQQSSQTKIIVAQETGNVEPDYVTFFGTTKTIFQASVTSIFVTYSTSLGFGGVGVHYLEPFLQLK